MNSYIWYYSTSRLLIFLVYQLAQLPKCLCLIKAKDSNFISVNVVIITRKRTEKRSLYLTEITVTLCNYSLHLRCQTKEKEM